ncbi:hypothetical protein BV25DRAFT_461344 [Artomyces pyxidatus]|uniref:Uncharacterized protein n=1 Tax=Artomyces pyxidatus TaxID=48021 RepID=A0ACB8T3B8_9AGAM|nr:hypothetical protein BV25DRAFT_461344 [Artomyces pyxidatus]
MDIAFPVYLDEDHVMMHLDYMLPIPEQPERIIPASPACSIPEDPFVTPTSSSNNLLCQSSPTSLKPLLWLHRRQRPPQTHNSPTPSPTDTRASFLTSLLHARWPKSEPEDPIFGQTTPRALSPFRGQPRPPSQLSMPRSILRADSRSKSQRERALGSVKFAASERVWEYAEDDDDDADLPFDQGYGLPGADPDDGRRPWWYGPREKARDIDADSVTTYPPPRERERGGDSFFRRFIGSSGKSHARGHRPALGKGVGEKPTISGPMPLLRAASVRELKDMHHSHEVAKEKTMAAAAAKKGGKMRTFWGRRAKAS